MYKERDEKKRAAFVAHIKTLDQETLVYLDESGIDSFIHKPFAWSVRGTKVFSEVSGKRYARESFIAALCGKEVLAPLCFQGTCNTTLFNLWLEDFLVPVLKPGQTLILDNAAFHKSERTREIIQNAGCHILFLPPYSPDLNPIEVFWANLKAKIKKIIKNFSNLSGAIDHAFQV